ncbi:class C sortase [Pimelobacter sp. 30-1]|uniref:class C sortase n=1 Tax=Pimelobacter sp. 30-1 TaxID=2004991 RepID=UPI001C05BC71|nr:class C sortase [Pimelobacter sp. 30-1]MBU2697093.1 hypothetical protein [Pimelobacter sp. 30-1]
MSLRTPPARVRRPRARVRWDLLVVVVMVWAGLGLLLYPAAATWYADIGHRDAVTGYAREVEQTAPAARSRLLEDARRYNASLPHGRLQDPWTSRDTAPGLDPGSYEQQLALADAGGVIGRISYPRLGIQLPIYHGTAPSVLTKGAGHLFGSSLPVGGAGSHAVLTSHSGYVHKLFDDLHEARRGDLFAVNVLDQTLYYEVDGVETVEPDQTESLRIEPGADLLTLVTCAPIGVNSHRLLVRGHRVDAPATPPAGTAILGSGADRAPAGFPWWLALLLGGGGTATGAVVWLARRGRQGESNEGESDEGENG